MTSTDDCTARSTCTAEGGTGQGNETGSQDDGAEGAAPPASDALDAMSSSDDATTESSSPGDARGDALTNGDGPLGDANATSEGGMIRDAANGDAADAVVRDVAAEVSPALDGCTPTTATEDCINGLDDDCNGLIDCAESICQAAGYACTAAAPTGWSGPAILWTGTLGTSAPACPTGYQSALDAHAGPTGSPDACTCTCASSGATCSASGTFHADQVCANPTCATVTPDSSGACTPVVPTSSCGSAGSYTMGSSLPTASGGTCTPSVMTTPGSAASWTTSARVCSWMGRVDKPGGCTNPGEQCLLGPMPGFGPTMCIYQGGDVSCPTAFPNKTLLYSGESDSRRCGSCGCSTRPAGGTCTGTVTLYGGTSGCTGTSATYTLGSSCQGYMTLSPTPSYVQAHYTMTTPATCSVTAQPASTGSVTGTGPTTVCCK
ncbi:MAG: hypothetical protein M3O46_00510 [Myxococcota bacterium]|nr:hypothetical protein [Myxococcota bacterium]